MCLMQQRPITATRVVCSSAPTPPPRSATRRSLLLVSTVVPALTLAPKPFAEAQQPAADLAQGFPADYNTRPQRIGPITVPGLSSFSFLHGTLTGVLAVLLVAADKLLSGGGGSVRSANPNAAHKAPHPVAVLQAADPDVDASLRRILGLTRELSPVVADPAVRSALQEVRADVRCIVKYSDDDAVMEALARIMQIEGELEQLGLRSNC